MLKFSEMWPAGVPFSQLLYPCDIAPIVLAVPSFLAQQDVLGPSYYFLFPKSRINHFFKELLSF